VPIRKAGEALKEVVVFQEVLGVQEATRAAVCLQVAVSLRAVAVNRE
jgi:hypothetical protein